MSTSPAPLSFTVVHTGEAAVRRLAELRIHHKVVENTIHQCRAVRANCTGNDARSARGILSWIQLLRGLRDGLREDFRADNLDGFELTVRRDNELAFIVSQGTSRQERRTILARSGNVVL